MIGDYSLYTVGAAANVLQQDGGKHFGTFRLRYDLTEQWKNGGLAHSRRQVTRLLLASYAPTENWPAYLIHAEKIE